MRELVGDETNYVVTTDEGREFSRLSAVLPDDAVHREKDPADRNATAEMDRGIQILKSDLASTVAKKGGDWSVHFPKLVNSYNNKTHDGVHGPPAQIETKNGGENPQYSRVLQNNAAKFVHNRTLTQTQI